MEPYVAPLPPAIEPIDLRPDRKRLHASASPSGDVEAYAARAISRCTGAQVVIQDDGTSYMMPDIRIEYPGRAPGIVECVLDMDREYASTYASLLKHGRGIPMTIELYSTDRMWWAGLAPGANVKMLQERIADAIDRFFKRLGDDVPGVMALTDRLPPIEEVAALRALGVAEIGSRPLVDDEAAVIHLRTASIFGSSVVLWSELLDWIRNFLRAPETADVRAKLANSGAEERHAFVAASHSSPWAVYHLLNREMSGDLPTEPPDLPAEVTHLWLLAVPPTGRCLTWWPDRGWFDPRHGWATQ